MVAGFNIKIRLWDITNQSDDVVGGAVITGTVVGIFDARLQANPDQQLLLQQGLETERTFSLTTFIQPAYYSYLKERNEIDVYAPTDHPYYGDRFRIRSIRFSDLNPRDPRNYVMMSLSRSVRSHGQQ